VERDFSRAILEVVEKIKSRNHPGGAIILVVKYGADLKNLGLLFTVFCPTFSFVRY
jgi:hypothetical protein